MVYFDRFGCREINPREKNDVNQDSDTEIELVPTCDKTSAYLQAVN